MPSKLQKAIAAVKDQTSISLAKVGVAESSSLEVTILKATTHVEIPVDERYVTEILRIVSSNRTYAGSCARALGRRIGRTRNWVVALKSLMIVLRVFQDGDPHFPKEILQAMKRGYKILNLSSFRDDSNTSCPWDFTAFVRTFALYLDERLDCFLTGKLQRRKSYHQSERSTSYSRKNEPIVRDMKPSVLLDRILHWQKLLDRAIATQPTGAARTNQVVQTCLYAIIQETFDLYRDISDGLALLLDSFFHLQYTNCVSAFQTCVKASKQFGELSTFYDLCKSIGVGRISEYPSVQKVSEELIETLQEFLKDQSSFPGTNGRWTPGVSGNYLPAALSPNSESGSVRQSEFVESQRTPLEELIGRDEGFSPDSYSDPGREKPTQLEECYSTNYTNDTASVQSEPIDHRGIRSAFDHLSLDDPSPPNESQGQRDEETFNEGLTTSSSRQGWELVLFETATNQPSTQLAIHENHDITASNNNGFEVDLFNNFSATSTLSLPPLSNEHNYNPFLQDSADLNGSFEAQYSNASNEFGTFGYTSFGPGCKIASFSDNGFPADLAVPATSNADMRIGETGISSQTFHSEFGNGNTDKTLQLDWFDELGKSSNISSNTDISDSNHVGFSEPDRSCSTSYLDGQQTNLAGTPTTFNRPDNVVSTTHHARFASADLSASSAFSSTFNSGNASVDEQKINHARFGSSLSTTSSTFSDNLDSFSGYSNGTIPPTLSEESGDRGANAIVCLIKWEMMIPSHVPSSKRPQHSAPRS